MKICPRFALTILLLSKAVLADQLAIEEYAPGGDTYRFNWPTHIAFSDGLEIVTDLRNNRVVYRQSPTHPFQLCPIPLKGPHSVAFSPDQDLYYANDTDSHRLVAFADLAQQTVDASAREIAGEQLRRPHDLVRDPANGWIYTINPDRPIVFRFRSFNQLESHLDLGDELGYSRALTFVNGVLYVVGSSHGGVLAIDDFESGEYTKRVSAGKKVNAPAGNWEKTGLVLNDIEFYQGWWYASSYFTPAYSEASQDFDKNKLIRFREWEDFEAGTWEDISHLLPTEIVPYYFTRHRDSLYLVAFYHDDPPEGGRDAIYRIYTPSQEE